MSFYQEFTIHPVGQGLFYSGLIKYQDEVKFRMVFDCGSIPGEHVLEEVNLYRDADFRDKKVLDLLVISHFDKDHVSHIGSLLADGIKVKRLVLPFITFVERLFLVFRWLDENDGYNPGDNPDDDFFVRFTIDPIGTLNENLDEDSEIYIIDGESDNPILPDKEEPNQDTSNANDEKRFIFDFDSSDKEEITSDDILTSEPIAPLKKVNHTKKGSIKVGGMLKLMEFLFYRRKISPIEDEFYQIIRDKFIKLFSINATLPTEELLSFIIEVVKGIRSATPIKRIFIEAIKEMKIRSTAELNIRDMNTTALCLLHRNLKGILYLEGYRDEERFRHPYFLHEISSLDFSHIQKFISAEPSRIVSNYFNYHFYWRNWYYRQNNNFFVFPNTMLTSDGFLLTVNQVTEYTNHYKNYWGDFWMIQIPHHGSEKSSDKLLHSHIPHHSFNFINYGVGNKDSHPSASVINDLVATGNSAKLIPVNQYTGLIFTFSI